ncbi:MAG: extracellular solute-binding protein [Clostridia bacterium]|nr:extracellular solute-binding protein [Clostridia bacterium]
MKKMIKWIILALVIVIGATMVSCGPEPYVEPVLPEGYKVEPKGKIKVSTYLRSGNDSEVALDKWIKTYNEKYPDVTVRKDIIDWGQFVVQVASGDIGDVYYSAEGNTYDYAVRYKAAMPLDAYIENLNIDVQQVYSKVYDQGLLRGYLYFVPSDITRTVFLCNLTMLREAGLDKPTDEWTWDDLVNKYCPALTKTAADGSLEQTGILIDVYGESFPIIYFFYGWGGQWSDKVNKKVRLASDENVVRGVEELVSLIRRGYASTGGLQGEIGAMHANLQNPQSYGFIYSHRQGMLWQERVANMEQYKAVGLEMDVVCPPLTPVRTIPAGTFGYIVYSKTKNPDAAATFALTLLTYDGQVAFNSIIGGGIPTRRDVIETDAWKLPFDKGSYNYDAFAKYPEAISFGWASEVPPELYQIFHENLHTIIADHLNNKRDFKDTLQLIETKCNELWATLLE